MTRAMFVSLLSMALLASIGGAAGAAAADRPTSIPFADLGNIQDWKPDGQNGMYIKSQRGKWYYATFWAPCFELPYSETVAFVTEPGGSLNKFSSIMAGGDRCWFRTFEPSGPPSGKSQ